MEPKIAVIISPWFQKTKSFDFLLNLLYERYTKDHVDLLYDEYSTGGKTDRSYIADKDKYGIIIFLQILPSAKILYRLRGHNIVYVPMYDNFQPYKLYLQYLKIWNVRCISFSLLVHNFLHDSLGVESLYIQYYLPPLPYSIDYTGKKVFRWYRGNISWDEVKTLLGEQKIDVLTIKNMPDTFYKKLCFTDYEIQKYNIRIIDTFFPTHDEHYQSLAQHNIYISPRRKEGIGMSFLDALSMGMCVVGYNESTMDEYIVHNVDGLLTNFAGVLALDNYDTLGATGKIKYMQGYTQWEQTKKNIISFLDKNYVSIMPSILHIIVYSSVYYVGTYLAKIIWKLKLFVKT